MRLFGASEEEEENGVTATDSMDITRDPRSYEDLLVSARYRLSKSSLSLSFKDDLDKSGFQTRDRVNNILSVWGVRGAHRPITDFYTEVCTLGSGAYGLVSKWKWKTSSTKEDVPYVAVKQIKWQHVWGGVWRDKSKEDAVRMELKMLLVIDHPFIVRFREWFEDPCKGIFFVMELCEGRSLQAMLDEICSDTSKESRMQHLSNMRRYFREVMYAVSYIHGLDPPVVHRDLKPDNVLLHTQDPASPIKLIDFGLATEDAHGEGENYQVGTMVFMSPEMFTKTRGKFTEEMDLWSLGIMFAWVFTALDRGSMQHPFLPAEDGVGFDVDFLDLHKCFKELWPLREEYFEGRPHVLELAAGLLRHRPQERTRASEALQLQWLRTDDMACAASAAVLRRGGVLDNLASYQQLKILEKRILTLVVETALDSEVAHLQRTFRILDTNGDGKLSKEELVAGFRKNDVEADTDVLDSLFEELDPTGQQEISYNEWLAVTVGQRILQSEQARRFAFRTLDTQGAGIVTFDDLVGSVGEEEATRVTSGDSRHISYREFSRMVDGVSMKRSSHTGSQIFQGWPLP